MKHYIVVTFAVTETCQNGKERRFKKSIYTAPFRYGKYVVKEQRIAECINLLKEYHYYNIEFISMSKTDLLVIE